MHTDEYEISLSREIDVCKGRMKAIKKSLQKMEKKYGIATDNFLKGLLSGGKVSEVDGKKWTEDIELLSIWESKQKEFEALYTKMKK
jgi:hypothetical protein